MDCGRRRTVSPPRRVPRPLRGFPPKAWVRVRRADCLWLSAWGGPQPTLCPVPGAHPGLSLRLTGPPLVTALPPPPGQDGWGRCPLRTKEQVPRFRGAATQAGSSHAREAGACQVSGRQDRLCRAIKFLLLEGGDRSQVAWGGQGQVCRGVAPGPLCEVVGQALATAESTLCPSGPGGALSSGGGARGSCSPMPTSRRPLLPRQG